MTGAEAGRLVTEVEAAVVGIEAARARLARAQAELLAALVAGAPPPAGFDPARLRVQADALTAKRREVTALLRPDLVEAAGERYRERFDAYALAHPRPAAGARADAEAFARTLPNRAPIGRIARLVRMARARSRRHPHRRLARGRRLTAGARPARRVGSSAQRRA